MSGPVDVLAVLDVNANRLDGWSVYPYAAAEQRKAIAAVAELIEAVKEYRKRYGNCGAPIQQSAADHLDAALANVGGAK